ncbi:hypothetical protein GCM10009412_39300 [Aeromonas salmonicida subsp. achromogenes]
MFVTGQSLVFAQWLAAKVGDYSGLQAQFGWLLFALPALGERNTRWLGVRLITLRLCIGVIQVDTMGDG